MTMITTLIAGFTTSEAINRATPDATTAIPYLRVGKVRIKDGNRTGEVVVVFHDGSENATISDDAYAMTQLDTGHSAATEERAMLTGSWVRALKNFIKNPVLFAKMFSAARKERFF
ncbi:hypothetical protein F442_03530 [Phytophthora nicotianae P10297]|uniref:Uncharacterized protein n=1 Tax=Phytophthora nicotianae P10297 TaxID=1317064 RepID=W2ZVF7_PHYNI|nr:hypothetical protein F442_03530 [Phytophthora nicotianae P10297]